MSDLAKEPAVPLMQRYAKSLSFEARRAYDMLMDLRKRVPLVPPGTPLPEIEEPQNETNPCPETDTPPSGPDPPTSATSTEPRTSVSGRDTEIPPDPEPAGIEEPQNETNPCPEMNTPPSATGAALHTTEPCEQAESEAELLLPQSNNRHLAILPDH